MSNSTGNGDAAPAAASEASLSSKSSSVQVAIRVRPMLHAEAGSTSCLKVLQSSEQNTSSNTTDMIRIGGSKEGPLFCFDETFGTNTTQDVVYNHRIVPLVKNLLEGYNATTLAYGQTGSGKTFTMMGPSTSTTMSSSPNAGIIPRAISQIFKDLASKQEAHEAQASGSIQFVYHVRMQFLELYGEEIRDLMTSSSNSKQDNSKLVIRDIGMDEPEVMGATQLEVTCAEEALVCLTRGMLRRVTASTAMNAESSRSHAILSVMVEQSTSSNGSAESSPNKSSAGQQQPQHVTSMRSKFNFVDLAGSERQKRTKAEGKRLREGININQGLLVLGNVISALGDPKKAGKTFVPYRDSKLTRLLKGSLGGNHKTLMIACVSPSSNNWDESLNCLRYANRAKNIQNNAIVNVDAGTRMVAELRAQVAALATELIKVVQADGGGGEASLMISDAYSVEYLKTLIDGSKTSNPNTPRSNNVLPLSPATPLGASSTPLLRHHDDNDNERFRVFQSQLDETRALLQDTTEELQSTTEELFTVRAEKELYRLRCTETTKDGPSLIEKAFLDKAAAYEREIATLKEAVQAAPPSLDNVTRASRALFQERSQLQHIQSELDKLDDDVPEMTMLRSRVLQSMSPEDALEAEEKAQDAELSKITNDFLPSDDEEGDDENENTDIVVSAEANILQEQDNRRQELELNLAELSRSIDDKEGLIEQLQSSQEKYAAMRSFYEGKLKEMEQQVQEREEERQALVKELAKLESTSPKTKDLALQLKDKERHISTLRKRQSELANLTKVSSRNETEIGRLKQDIVGMKQKKVDLQKMINAERKAHLGEVKRLKKEVVQRDREVNKWKRISGKKSDEAERAQLMAKTRLDQIGALKAKYTESERRVRVKTVKRGVLQKAGLDNVIVGRRAKTTSTKTTESKVDAIRDFLDKKVADIGKKESIADKLANEWEDHIQLKSKQEQLVKNKASRDVVSDLQAQLSYKEERIRKLAQKLGNQQSTTDEGAKTASAVIFEDDDFKALVPDSSSVSASKLASKVLFGMVVRERRRVASLARTASSLNEKVKETEAIISQKDAAFQSYKIEESAERANLAQNHQEQILSLMNLVSEEADSSTPTPTASTKRSTRSNPNLFDEQPTALDSTKSSRMILLANDRIEALERQLREVKAEQNSLDVYKEKELAALDALAAKNEECDQLRDETSQLRDALKQIQQSVKSNGDARPKDKADHTIADIVSSSLRAAPRNTPPKPPTAGQSYSSSDEEEEIPDWAGDIMADLAVIAQGDVPSALLKSPSFQDAHAVMASSSSKDDADTVFDRLTNPTNFTGVQKRKTKNNVTTRRAAKARSSHKNDTKSLTIDNMNQNERHALSQKVSDQLESFFLGGVEHDSHTPTAASTDSKTGVPSTQKRSVFDRLLSPSMYTGTQKDRMKGKGNHQGDIAFDDDAGNNHTDDPKRNSSEPKEDIDITAQVEAKVSEYAQQDVFERLQKTQTQSAAVKNVREKKNSNNAKPSANTKRSQEDELLDEILKSGSSDGTDEESVEANVSRGRTSDPRDGKAEIKQPDIDITAQVEAKVSQYTQQDVFERLQKTRTQSAAVKMVKSEKLHNNQSTRKTVPKRSQEDSILDEILNSSSIDSNSGENQPDITAQVEAKVSQYAQDNVFERLQRATTSNAVKKKAPVPFSPHATVHRSESVSVSPPTVESSSPSERDDVFERLQRTTTHVKKKNASAAPADDQ